MKTRILLLAVCVCLCMTFGTKAFSADAVADAKSGLICRESSLIDINSATIDELQTLNGIGPVLARNIIEYRQKNGPFKSVDDLLSVDGIGTVKLESIRNMVKATTVKR